MQDQESLSINSSDISISKSTPLEMAVPASKIANLSSGEFVGSTADNPETKISLKTFHCQVLNDHDALRMDKAAFQEIPVFRKVDYNTVMKSYHEIKNDINYIIEDVMDQIMNDPFLVHLIPKSMLA